MVVNIAVSTNTLKCGDACFVATCYLKISSTMPINPDLALRMWCFAKGAPILQLNTLIR